MINIPINKGAGQGIISNPVIAPFTTSPPLVRYLGSQFDGGTNGADIATLVDCSGFGRNASAAGIAGNRPIIAQNAINTNMTAWRNVGKYGFNVTLPVTLSNTSRFSWFMVVNMTAVAATERNLMGIDDGAGTGIRMGYEGASSLKTWSHVTPNVGGQNAGGTWFTDNVWHCIVGTVSPSAAIRKCLLFVDSPTSSIDLQYTMSDTIWGTSTQLRISYGYTGALPTVNMAEFAFWNYLLGRNEIAKWQNYAKTTYGL